MINIIIPTYSRRQHLEWAVKSVLKQTSDQWRLWIGTDGVQKDDTLQWLKQFDDHRQIEHVHLPEKCGGHLTVEALLHHLDDRELVICMADDDLLYPNAVEAHLEALTRYPDLDASVGGWTFQRIDYETNEVIEVASFNHYDDFRYVDKQKDLEATFKYNPYVLAGCCYRVGTLRSMRHFECVYPNPEYAQWDWLITAVLLIEDYEVVSVPYLCGVYTVRDGMEQASSSMAWGKHFMHMYNIMRAADMPELSRVMWDKVVHPQAMKDIGVIMKNMTQDTYHQDRAEIDSILSQYFVTRESK